MQVVKNQPHPLASDGTDNFFLGKSLDYRFLDCDSRVRASDDF